MSFETLTIEWQSNGRVDLTFARPELLNRVDDDSRREFIEALQSIGADSRARCIVLAAEGEVFSAGGDFDMMRRKHGNPRLVHEGTADSLRLIEELNKIPVPIVVAMHGHAVGVGSTVVLSSDVVVASTNAKLIDSHVNIGLVAGDGGVVVWPAAMGMMKAKRHLLTGDPLGAEEAHRLGIISDLVDSPGEVLGTARDIADRICSLPPLAVRGTKRSFNHVMSLRAAEVLELSLMYEAETMSSQDLLEAIDAFTNRRQPRFSGE